MSATDFCPRTALLVGCTVSPTIVPVLEIVVDDMTARNPKATTEQMVDEIFALGVLTYHRNHNLPRPGSNPDMDG